MPAPMHSFQSWGDYARKRGLPVDDEDEQRMRQEGTLPAEPEPLSMAPLSPAVQAAPLSRMPAPPIDTTDETMRRFSAIANRRKPRR